MLPIWLRPIGNDHSALYFLKEILEKSTKQQSFVEALIFLGKYGVFDHEEIYCFLYSGLCDFMFNQSKGLV